MRRFFAFRSSKFLLRGLLDEGEWKSVGDGVVEVELPSDDARWRRICRRDRLLALVGLSVHYGHWTRVEYEPGELDRERLFQLTFLRPFLPYGFDCGTEYDQSARCPQCRSGLVQRSFLRLKYGRIPKGEGFSETYFGCEWVCTEAPARLLIESEFAGLVLAPVLPSPTADAALKGTGAIGLREMVRDCGAFNLPSEASDLWRDACQEWLMVEHPRGHAFQVLPVGPRFDLIESRAVWRDGICGNDFYGRPGCGTDHVVGVSQMDTLRVRSSTLSGADFQTSSKLSGSSGGFDRAIVVSRDLKMLLEDPSFKGLLFDKVIEE